MWNNLKDLKRKDLIVVTQDFEQDGVNFYKGDVGQMRNDSYDKNPWIQVLWKKSDHEMETCRDRGWPCDSTWIFYGIDKKNCWSIEEENYSCLKKLSLMY